MLVTKKEAATDNTENPTAIKYWTTVMELKYPWKQLNPIEIPPKYSPIDIANDTKFEIRLKFFEWITKKIKMAWNK